jgi:hypothetical protein
MMTDWEGIEDEIADAIQDSMDIDWTSRIGARAVVRFMKERDEAARERKVCGICGAVGSADHGSGCSESW